MSYPNFNEEKKLWRRGFNIVVGLDEAGRGPLAGPVVASAVMIKAGKRKHSNIQLNVECFGVRDSKQLSQKQREKFYRILTGHPAIRWGIGIVSEKVIDKINILEATKLAMQKAIKNLSYKFDDRQICKTVDFILIDGNFGLQAKIPRKSIIKGDQKVFSIAAASIIAKVTRDRIMQKMHKKYPQYRFDLHKGYGTAMHLANLEITAHARSTEKRFFR